MARRYFDNVDPCGFEQLTGINAATALASPTGTVTGKIARFAVLSVEGANVRWRDDGTNPTTAIGNRIMKDTTENYTGDLKAIKFIDEAGGGLAKVNVSYSR